MTCIQERYFHFQGLKMKSDTERFMQTLQYIEKYYALHKKSRLGKDLSSQMAFLNAALALCDEDIDELRISLDMQAFTFLNDKKFVVDEITAAIAYAKRCAYLPNSYIDNEYVIPLYKLKKLLCR